MSFTATDISPGDLIVWQEAQPPFAAYVPGTGPYLALHVAVRLVSDAEVGELDLDAESGPWWWAVLPAQPQPPVVIPAVMVLAVHKAERLDPKAAEYFA